MRIKVLLLAILLPTFLWAHPDPNRDRDRHCRPEWDKHCAVAVPEGGSSLAYLALSGTLVLGAIALKRRKQV